MQPTQKTHWPSVLQVALSGLMLILLLPSAAGLLVVAAMGGLAQGASGQEVISLVHLAWMSALAAALQAPALVFGLARLLNWPLSQKERDPRRWLLLALAAWPLALAAGYGVNQLPGLSLALLPPLQIAVVALPLAAFVLLGQMGLPRLTRQQNWGTVSFSLAITPLVTIAAEVVVGGLLLVALVVWLTSNPEAMEQIYRAGQRLSKSQMDPEALSRIIAPFLKNPQIIIGALAFTAGLVPLLEELFKPLALWLLAGKRLTPAQGFSGGLLAGAMFALFESLGMLASAAGAQDWLTLVIGRTGTGLLHVVTTALVGWGLASAWQAGRYLRLGLAYLCAVLLHGIWNLFGILMGLLPVGGAAELPQNLQSLSRLSQIAPLALGVLFLVLFSILLRGARLLRQEQLKP